MKKLVVSSLFFAIAVGGISVPVMADEHDGHDNHQYVRHDEWKKGERMRDDDWRRGEHVDYRQQHLRAPPHGYEWRQVDGNYVLAAVATGVIASVIAASVAAH